MSRPRVVILGGGFGSVHSAFGPRHAAVVDRSNQHLLLEVATPALAVPVVATPIPKVLARQTSAKVLLDKATDIDFGAKTMRLEDGELDYDSLVVATGATHNYFYAYQRSARAILEPKG